MIKPTVGRVVWVTRTTSLDLQQPEVGFITYVHTDRCINVAGFDAGGAQFAICSLPLVQDGDPTPAGNHAVWMPYQKGQAAKAEHLEAQLDETKIPPKIEDIDFAKVLR